MAEEGVVNVESAVYPLSPSGERVPSEAKAGEGLVETGVAPLSPEGEREKVCHRIVAR